MEEIGCIYFTFDNDVSQDFRLHIGFEWDMFWKIDEVLLSEADDMEVFVELVQESIGVVFSEWLPWIKNDPQAFYNKLWELVSVNAKKISMFNLNVKGRSSFLTSDLNRLKKEIAILGSVANRGSKYDRILKALGEIMTEVTDEVVPEQKCKCGSYRILKLDAKCGSSCSIQIRNKDWEHSIPKDTGIAGKCMDIGFSFCMECGQMQGNFPLPTTKIEMGTEEL